MPYKARRGHTHYLQSFLLPKLLSEREQNTHLQLSRNQSLRLTLVRYNNQTLPHFRGQSYSNENVDTVGEIYNCCNVHAHLLVSSGDEVVPWREGCHRTC